MQALEKCRNLPVLDRARLGYRLGNAPLVDGMYKDGFLDPICGMVMGETAETLAKEYGLTREMQDAFALRSQKRAAEAMRAGRFTVAGETRVLGAEPDWLGYGSIAARLASASPRKWRW